MRSQDEVSYERIVKQLEQWYERHGRKFPWREIKDPYIILVTEFLLQRTKAETIEKVYTKFFSRYKSVKELASVSIEELRSFFSGLGLFYRGERLYEVAKQLMEKYGGEIPCDMESLLKMRGVGVYIASAVLNFGCDIPTPVIDKNVLRVLNRLAGITRERVGREFIMKLYQFGDHRKIAFALIDLGALICVEKPKCDKCPLINLCKKYPLKKGEWKMLRKIITSGQKVKLQEQPVYSKKKGLLT